MKNRSLLLTCAALAASFYGISCRAAAPDTSTDDAADAAPGAASNTALYNDTRTVNAQAFMPETGRPESQGGAIVDEPVGERSSLGLTLWHLGHNAAQIEAFGRFLKTQNIRPEDVTPPSRAQTPNDTRQILIEPELSAPADHPGWTREGNYLATDNRDLGTDADIPLRIDRAGLYRFWTLFEGATQGFGVTSLKIYRANDTSRGPVWSDEIFDRPSAQDGPTWQDFLVDLNAGDYVVRLGHLAPTFQAGRGVKPVRLPRRIDCFYLSDALWQSPPSDAGRAALRQGAPINGAQWTRRAPLSGSDAAQWKQWSARPLSWEERAQNPRGFDLSYRFWQQQVEAIAQRPESADYRDLTRQIIFDPTWNLLGTPSAIKRETAGLSQSVMPTTKARRDEYVFFPAGSFQNMQGAWKAEGSSLRAGYGFFQGTASTDVPTPRAGRYFVWVHFKNTRAYYASWRATATSGGQTASYDHDQKYYDTDWGKLGELQVANGQSVHLEVTPLPSGRPLTNRYLREFLITTDPAFIPAGNNRPPLSSNDYQAQARSAGADPADRYLLWPSADAYNPPLSLEAGTPGAFPESPVGDNPQKIVAMPLGGTRAVRLNLRNLTNAPLTMRVNVGPLTGAGGTFENHISWRVMALSSVGAAREAITPNALLRRPDLTVPPLNVAGCWLTIDGKGVPAGDYSSTVSFAGQGAPTRGVTLRVRVSSVRVVPRRVVYVGGYSKPPEGEIYKRDFAAHGLNVWYDALSKAEMQRLGVQMLMISARNTSVEGYRATIAQLKAMGLSYSDWVFVVRDEPNGQTEQQLSRFLVLARLIREADPQARMAFNPAERATLATFQVLQPYASFWIPFTIHRTFPANEVQAKRAIFTSKPWMFYTTPAYGDKNPLLPVTLRTQIRDVPADPGDPLGTAFFSLYSPWQDAWDAGHEYIRDASVMILPSRYGPVWTPAYEAIREAAQDANLGRMIIEKNGPPRDERSRQLLSTGTTEQLLQILEGRNAPSAQPELR